MVKRVFVFSDMQFDQASGNRYETDHMVIKRKFEAHNYPVPEIVYWNLSNMRTVPTTKDEKGVALISGYSPQLFKLFLAGEKIDPSTVMRRAIDKLFFELAVLTFSPHFKHLKVED